MQIKFKRSRTANGYCLDMVMSLSAAEQQIIAAHQLGKRTIYELPYDQVKTSKVKISNLSDNAATAGAKNFLLAATGLKGMELTISFDGVGVGKRFEGPEMGKLLSIEREIKKNCETLMDYVATALTFQGSEHVYDIDGTDQSTLVASHA